MSNDGLIDTSVFIAHETGRPVEEALLPDRSFVSIVTVAELEAGVLVADAGEPRERRLATLTRVAALAPLSVGPEAAHHWARMRAQLAAHGRRINVNDLWIAATAAAGDLPVITQDDDFDVLAELGLVEVVRV